MSIVEKYLWREIFKYLAIVTIAVVGIYLVVDLFDKLDNFLEAEVSTARIIYYFQLKIPLIVAQILPIGSLLAVLITFGLMNKNNELIALRCSGLSVYYLLKPVLAIGAICTLCLFFVSEILVPITVGKANRIWDIEVKKKAEATSSQTNIWIKGQRAIYNFEHFNPQKKSISGIELNYFDDQFRLVKRVIAREGVYQQNHWIFYDVMEQLLDAASDQYVVSFYPERTEPLEFEPEELTRVAKRSEEMNVVELFDYIHDVESEGYDATNYRVDFQAKFALPLVCIIMGIVATGIAVRQKAREGLSVNIAMGVSTIFFYWIMHSFCVSLGHGGVLPPVVAAWIADVIFLSLGLFIVMNAD
jgi:lipopolysaccharide export system permease protein